VALHSVWE